jgi:hypothetical protein
MDQSEPVVIDRSSGNSGPMVAILCVVVAAVLIGLFAYHPWTTTTTNTITTVSQPQSGAQPNQSTTTQQQQSTTQPAGGVR